MASTGRPLVSEIQLAEDSYRRCQGEPFFQAFYHRLLRADPAVREKFANTDFERQNRLLQHGIGLLLSFGRRPNPMLLARIAERHSSRDLDIAPALHEYFVDSLIETVREYDAACTPAVEDAWRVAVAPGIEFIVSRYASAADADDNASAGQG
ncbi:MAG TPA: hypothetical protein VM764_00955 [Gemmatimonadaceae bacterium]|jgi:hemoglobin-like flavoprotein|nr:hypothetical protein [Gemmatimonadaceae bacterium]